MSEKVKVITFGWRTFAKSKRMGIGDLFRDRLELLVDFIEWKKRLMN